MFKEIFDYCLTPASLHARATGYLYEAVAFEARARRNEKHWKPHWALCQNLVENFCSQYPQSQSLMILGSGCLFEIPKKFLTQNFQKIVLVDQVFPRSVRSWVQLQSIEIQMMECDLSRSFPKVEGVDLAISSNLLSQIALPMPKRKAEIESQHLSDLQSLDCPVLLWTDHEKVFTQVKSGEVLHRMPTIETRLSEPIEKWRWNLAPAPEWDREIDMTLEMSAILF
jgi:hypothetical protein